MLLSVVVNVQASHPYVTTDLIKLLYTRVGTLIVATIYN